MEEIKKKPNCSRVYSAFTNYFKVFLWWLLVLLLTSEPLKINFFLQSFKFKTTSNRSSFVCWFFFTSEALEIYLSFLFLLISENDQ